MEEYTDYEKIVSRATPRILQAIKEKYGKYTRDYSENPECKNNPFVVAVGTYEQPFFFIQNTNAIRRVLYTYDVPEYVEHGEERVILGQTITTGAGTAYSMPMWYEAIGATPTITLAATPNDTGSVAIYDESGTKISTFTVSGSTVTFTSGVVAGQKVEVRTYTYTTNAQTQTILIDNSIFAKGVKAVLETLEIESETEEAVAKLQWHFDRAIPSGNFTISTASAKEASTTSFNLRVVKPSSSTVVGKSLRIPIA
ncbi:hypothetical protein [Paenibacillus koleovorans]|uniref:hypothetical protein n=1 Tax=Paenibacillus koleovorans TaxID=121608 RepID=UPI000FDC74AA|nr:hypothetical protein [Paenibacillus koleovorans]